jgi:hypothetical protein
MRKITIIIFVVLVIIALFFVFGGKNETKKIEPDNKVEENTKEVSLRVDEELAPMKEKGVEQGSFSKIDEDFKNGKITLDEMYTYKLISMFGADKLPEKYSSDNMNNLRGDRIIMMIREDWDKLKPETQRSLELFVLSPTDEKSFFYHSNFKLREEIINNLTK